MRQQVRRTLERGSPFGQAQAQAPPFVEGPVTGDAARYQLGEVDPLPLGAIDGGTLVLFESQLQRGGAVYSPLAELPL